jgi:hypothetical protein
VRAAEVHPEDATIAFNLACYASDTGRIFSPTNGRNNGTRSLEKPANPTAFVRSLPLRHHASEPNCLGSFVRVQKNTRKLGASPSPRFPTAQTGKRDCPAPG